MIEREKAIRGLELCAYDPDPGQELKEIRSCPECPYYRAGCSPQLIRDALALLKEREAMPPKRIDGKRNHILKCSYCDTDLMSGMKFCPQCGRSVKLECGGSSGWYHYEPEAVEAWNRRATAADVEPKKR